MRPSTTDTKFGSVTKKLGAWWPGPGDFHKEMQQRLEEFWELCAAIPLQTQVYHGVPGAQRWCSLYWLPNSMQLKSPGFFSCHVTMQDAKTGLWIPTYSKIIAVYWAVTRSYLQEIPLNYESSEICSILTTYTTAYHSYQQLIFVQCARTLPMPFCCFLFRFSIPRPMTRRSIPAGRGLRTAGTVSDTGSFKSYPVNSVNFNETSIFYHLKPSFKESHIFVAQILTYPIW